jgi:transposase-like protein
VLEPIPFAGMVDISEPETKYCSSCMRYKAFNEGKIVETANKKISRFKCKSCLNKISARQYERVKK